MYRKNGEKGKLFTFLVSGPFRSYKGMEFSRPFFGPLPLTRHHHNFSPSLDPRSGHKKTEETWESAVRRWLLQTLASVRRLSSGCEPGWRPGWWRETGRDWEELAYRGTDWWTRRTDWPASSVLEARPPHTFSCVSPECWPRWRASHRTCTCRYPSPPSCESSYVLLACCSGHRSSCTFGTCRVFPPCGTSGGPSGWSSSWRLFHRTHRCRYDPGRSAPSGSEGQIKRLVFLFVPRP